jgi:hypothetical protein
MAIVFRAHCEEYLSLFGLSMFYLSETYWSTDNCWVWRIIRATACHTTYSRLQTNSSIKIDSWIISKDWILFGEWCNTIETAIL